MQGLKKSRTQVPAAGSPGGGRRERAERSVAEVITASGIPVAELAAAAAVLDRLAHEANLRTVDAASAAGGAGADTDAERTEEWTTWAVAAQFCDDAGHLGSRIGRYLERAGQAVPGTQTH